MTVPVRPGRAARVVVLGAGPCGLAAAVGATRAGHDVEVVEAADRVGGLSASITVAGQRVDLGSHRLHPVATPAVEALLDEALGDDLQGRRRRGRILLEGRWLDFPLRPTDMVANLPWSFTRGVLGDLVLRRGHAGASATPDDDALSVLRARLGPTVADRFYRPYLAKLYGVDPVHLHREVADRRVSARSSAAIVARTLRPRPDHDFRYPRRGFGQLAERLAGLARAAGARLTTATPVTAVRPRADGTVVVSSTGGEVVADAVISTLPAGLLARLAGAPSSVRRAGADLAHRGLHLVYVDLDAVRLSRTDAWYFPGAHTPVARISEPANYRTNPEDPSDHSVVCAEIPYGPGDRGRSPEELGEVVVTTLQRAGVTVPDVRSVRVVSRPRVYPVYTPASRRSLRILEDWVDDVPGVVTVGRQGLFTPDNTHHVLAMGLDAAGVVGSGGVDRRAWARLRAAYRGFVVED